MVMYPPLRQKSLTFWPFPSHRISFISVEISPRVNAIFRTVEISPRVGLLPQCWSRLRLSGRCLDLFLLWPTYYFFFLCENLWPTYWKKKVFRAFSFFLHWMSIEHIPQYLNLNSSPLSLSFREISFVLKSYYFVKRNLICWSRD